MRKKILFKLKVLLKYFFPFPNIPHYWEKLCLKNLSLQNNSTKKNGCLWKIMFNINKPGQKLAPTSTKKRQAIVG